MKAPAWTRGLSVSGWILGFVVVAAVVIGLWWVLIAGPARDRQAAASAKVGQAATTARTESAKDAIAAIETNDASQAEIDQQVKDAIATIHASDDPDAAAVRVLCQFKSARNLPECVL